ncbi:hypothetical protein [Chitinophaga sancti]|uniref:Uncharacterized protein n=1 Tax=Chitinophaga sancti TaxID=1004 RepID=A0A1K1T2M4_9BACT|nr:hypothetical protein [Chitinophaga sancti]WQD59539.1 hypothetical protein U0033_16725 [Chitinophaga sancti]WQG88327.1 hypothetical protein SR876_25740 [Chitinophaga sancti]SFW90750.1 hypothetical protein SAMN05661012_06670 [Chitinophaga sancti]
MKRTNIILSAIGFLSLVGGTLAFKVQHRFNGTLLCYTTVGIDVGADHIFAAVITTKYAINAFSKTLFCTVPGPNRIYENQKVAPSL